MVLLRLALCCVGKVIFLCSPLEMFDLELECLLECVSRLLAEVVGVLDVVIAISFCVVSRGILASGGSMWGFSFSLVQIWLMGLVLWLHFAWYGGFVEGGEHQSLCCIIASA
ncbi:hypothetical protein V6N13_092352 [Hibiscus sabdariffa]